MTTMLRKGAKSVGIVCQTPAVTRQKAEGKRSSTRTSTGSGNSKESRRRTLFVVGGLISSAASLCENRSALATGEEGDAPGATTIPQTFEPEVRKQDLAVFVAGVIPFIWATGEFWRRVLKGEVFGTGKDSVRFEMEGVEDTGAGGRKLTSTALNAAYLLFIIAGGSLGLALIAFLQARPS